MSFHYRLNFFENGDEYKTGLIRYDQRLNWIMNFVNIDVLKYYWLRDFGRRKRNSFGSFETCSYALWNHSQKTWHFDPPFGHSSENSGTHASRATPKSHKFKFELQKASKVNLQWFHGLEYLQPHNHIILKAFTTFQLASRCFQAWNFNT